MPFRDLASRDLPNLTICAVPFRSLTPSRGLPIIRAASETHSTTVIVFVRNLPACNQFGHLE
mgnify:CR=1 FL=1